MSTEYELLYLAIILFISFALRFFPRLFRKYGIAGDMFFQFALARILREHNFRQPPRLPRLLVPEHIYVPSLYALLIAPFSEKVQLRIERLTGALTDTSLVLIAYLVTKWFVNYYQLTHLIFLPLLVSFGLAIFPGFLRIGTGPRAYQGTPRVLAQVLYNLHIFAFLLFSVTGQIPYAILALIAGSLLFVTAKFAVQAMVFFAPFVIIGIDISYCWVLLGSFALSVAISRGQAFRFFLAQIDHSVFYQKRLFVIGQQINSKNYLKLELGNLRNYLSEAYQALKAIFRLNFLQAFKWVFKEKYFLHCLIIHFFPILFLFFNYQEVAPMNDFTKYLAILSVGGFIIYFLTGTQFFKFLGEPERYLEYTTIPVFILVGILLLNVNNWAILIAYIIYSSIAYFFYISHYLDYTKLFDQSFLENREMFETFNKEEEGNFMTVSGGHWEIYYRTNFPILSPGGNKNYRIFSIDDFMKIWGKTVSQPSPKYLLNNLNKFQITYLVGQKARLNNLFRKFDQSIFEKITEPIYENDHMFYCRVKPEEVKKALAENPQFPL